MEAQVLSVLLPGLAVQVPEVRCKVGKQHGVCYFWATVQGPWPLLFLIATLESSCEHLKPWYLERVPTAQVPHLQLLWTWASQVAPEVSALRQCSDTEVPD